VSVPTSTGRTRGNRANVRKGERNRVGEDVNGQSRCGASTTGQAPHERQFNGRDRGTNRDVNANVNANVHLDARQRGRIRSAIFADRGR
jgi:hypothetical protein